MHYLIVGYESIASACKASVGSVVCRMDLPKPIVGHSFPLHPEWLYRKKLFCRLSEGVSINRFIVSTHTIRLKLLEHSSLDLTNKVYMNVDPVLRHAVDQIPAGDWL